jgi:multidrug transporter EmrE-like cation transporter
VFVVEHEAVPARTIVMGHANVPALSYFMAPLGALPIEVAYAIWTALGVLALVAAALLLGHLAERSQRHLLFPLALLAPTSLIALVQGQTTPFILLFVAGSFRAPPFWSGVLLGATALRPQVLPLFALVALTDRRRAAGMIAMLALLLLVSFVAIGPEGMSRYPALLTRATTELRPGELGLAPLVRRLVQSESIVLYLALGGITFTVGAVAVLFRNRARSIVTRIVDASTWALLVAPHALLHDGVLAYPGVASASTTPRRTALWVGSGLAAALIQQAGIPVAPFYLLALFWGSGPRASPPLAASPTRP